MTTIALAIFFALFALMNLLETKIPGWVLGVAAILVVIALVIGGGWRNKATAIALLLAPCSLLLFTGCMTNSAKFFSPEVIQALSQNTNSIRFEVRSVHGTIIYERNQPYRVVQIP